MSADGRVGTGGRIPNPGFSGLLDDWSRWDHEGLLGNERPELAIRKEL